MRKGLSLVELLMAMFVTVFGVTACAGLLLVSGVRALQARELTEATSLAFSARATIERNPETLFYVFPTWAPGKSYAIGQTVISQRTAGGNNHAYRVTTAGTSGQGEPTWNTAGGSTGDGSIVWADSGLNDHYLIDPLGTYVNPAAVLACPRFNGGAASEAAAWNLCSSSDAWVEQSRGGVSLAGNTLTLEKPVGILSPASRAVMIDRQKRGQTRIVTGTGNALTLSLPVPAGFSPVQAFVQSQERRFTWMVSAHRNVTGFTTGAVAVFSRRSFADEDPVACGVSGPTVTPTGRVFTRKGGYVLNCETCRWHRITTVADNGTFEVNPAIETPTFRGSFFKGLVDVYPFTLPEF